MSSSLDLIFNIINWLLIVFTVGLDRGGGVEVHGVVEDERRGRDLHKNLAKVSQRPTHSKAKVLHFVSCCESP